MAHELLSLRAAEPHPQRVEIARYLLSRGAFVPPDVPEQSHPEPLKAVVFADGLARVSQPFDWAVGLYTAYGACTRIVGAITVQAISTGRQ